jgi:predicted RNase H-like HicB family nuclease
MDVRVAVEFTLPARIKKKGAWFISSCPPLDVHSQGRTRDEAEANLIDAVTSFFISCYERGTLDTVLRDSGFVPVKSSGHERSNRPIRKVSSVVVPLPFVIEPRPGRATASA